MGVLPGPVINSIQHPVMDLASNVTTHVPVAQSPWPTTQPTSPPNRNPSKGPRLKFEALEPLNLIGNWSLAIGN